jgi:hypothetical protein
VRIWDPKSRGELAVFKAHMESVYSVVVTSEGVRIERLLPQP